MVGPRQARWDRKGAATERDCLSRPAHLGQPGEVNMPCASCGIEGPTQFVSFRQNIGLVVMRLTNKVEAELCRPCMVRCFRSYTLTTLFVGWWGVISFLMTPVFLFQNLCQYISARKLAEPGLAATNIPLGGRPPRIASGPFALKLIVGVVAWTFVLGALASHEVDLTEKYAPALNAKLHGGEITDEDDAAYSFSKAVKDISALEAGFKSHAWDGFRAELLAREQYLTDLNQQNEKLQRKMNEERTANAGNNDSCESWALNEVGPALNEYTEAQNAFFSFAKNTSKLADDNRSAITVVSQREEEALTKLQHVFSDDAHKTCVKD